MKHFRPTYLLLASLSCLTAPHLATAQAAPFGNLGALFCSRSDVQIAVGAEGVLVYAAAAADGAHPYRLLLLDAEGTYQRTLAPVAADSFAEETLQAVAEGYQFYFPVARRHAPSRVTPAHRLPDGRTLRARVERTTGGYRLRLEAEPAASDATTPPQELAVAYGGDAGTLRVDAEAAWPRYRGTAYVLDERGRPVLELPRVRTANVIGTLSPGRYRLVLANAGGRAASSTSFTVANVGGDTAETPTGLLSAM